jgi:hypothetical protein
VKALAELLAGVVRPPGHWAGSFPEGVTIDQTLLEQPAEIELDESAAFITLIMIDWVT